jgi:Trypsin-co-occurring domain 1
MPAQRLILEDTDITYDVLIESTQAIQPTANDLEAYSPSNPRSGINQPTVPPEVRVKLAEVHRTIQGYTQYAIGAFRNLAIAEVEEINLKFNIKISAEGGIPMLASGKTESDFSIEVKCKFPKDKQP